MLDRTRQVVAIVEGGNVALLLLREDGTERLLRPSLSQHRILHAGDLAQVLSANLQHRHEAGIDLNCLGTVRWLNEPLVAHLDRFVLEERRVVGVRVAPLRVILSLSRQHHIGRLRRQRNALGRQREPVVVHHLRVTQAPNDALVNLPAADGDLIAGTHQHRDELAHPLIPSQRQVAGR